MMDEMEAKAWVQANVTDEQFTLIARYVDLLVQGSTQQNLIAPSTLPAIWSRHIADSLQLVRFAPPGAERWLDIGSGAGLPGIVVAIVSRCHVTLSEPRNLRVEFLASCLDALGLSDHAQIAGCKAQLMAAPSFDVISARAVTSCAAILELSRHLADVRTVYVLPKGMSAEEDVYNARKAWTGTFHVERSVVDPTSGIVVASGVRRK